MIYFITGRANKQDKYVKIGYSKNPEVRLKQLQTGCPIKLKLQYIMSGSFETEKALHIYYEKYRVPHSKEWFYFRGELKENLIHAPKNCKSIQQFVCSFSKKRSRDKLKTLNK